MRGDDEAGGLVRGAARDAEESSLIRAIFANALSQVANHAERSSSKLIFQLAERPIHLRRNGVGLRQRVQRRLPDAKPLESKRLLYMGVGHRRAPFAAS